MTADAAYRLLSAEEFLAIDFRAGQRAELDRGQIRMMTGGTRRHSRIQTNILGLLYAALKGSGCRPHGPDMAVRTGPQSVRYPDISIDCGAPEDGDTDQDKAYGTPAVIIEILSASTASLDRDVKLREYQGLPSVQTILLIDPDAEQVRMIQRLGEQSWRDDLFSSPTDVALPSLSLTLPHAAIFARG
jgi:Uma2 family endonuclease